MPDSNRPEKLSYIGALAALTLGLYLSSLYSYLLFHSLIEIITIAVAFTLFIIAWNTRKYLSNNYLRLLGISYAFIAFIDLLHTLVYKGMNIFPGYGVNLPTQLWIAARGLQAVTLIAAPFVVERRVDNRAIFGGYAAAVSVLVVMVYSGHFPDCFIEGKGLTNFKINSEYVITVLLLVSLYLLYRKRQHFNDKVFFLTASSIACTALSEISFTAYVSVYGFANMVGHFAKLAAFYLIYRAIVVTGIKEPFDLIFRDLKKAEEALQKSRDALEGKVRERTVELKFANEELKAEITERKQAEEALEKSEASLKLALETSHIGAWELNLLDNTANRTLIHDRIFGYKTLLPAWTFQIFLEHVLPEDRPYVEQSFIKAVETLSNWNFECRIRRIDGEVRWIHAVGGHKRNLEGKALWMSGIVQDITERKKAEQEIQKLNEELEQRVADRTSDLQKKGEELQRSQNSLLDIVKDLNLKTVELVDANSKLQDLDRLKSMFIASMSHELRTPLNSIIGFSSILFHEWLGPVAPEQKEKLSTILRAGKHLLNLINDVIDVSKIEAGRLESVIEDFDLSELIAEALSLFKNDMENKGLELAVETIPQDMHTDRRRLLQCIVNLISNAVKFTEKGSVRITAQRVEGQEKNEDFIKISVADTGIGIKEADMPKLFAAFIRIPSPISSKVKGTGLGLYLTKKIAVEILKGDILVKSRYGEGSIFSLRIPVRSQHRVVL